MRSDFSANFETELSRAGRTPIQLLAFHFPTAGTVRLSDRDLGPADGLSHTWAGLVEDWGTLEDVVARDPADVTIEARQMTVSILNRGDAPFSDYFLKEDPEGVTVDLYQWFAGLPESDMVLVDRLVVTDPIQFSERGRLVSLDLVSAVVNMETIVGGLLSAADWPNAKTDDIGKPIDLPFGNVGRIPALCARTAPAATLCGSILANSTVIAVNEDLGALGFSAAGVLQIAEELIWYGSRSTSQFFIPQRGYLTTAAEHLDRDEVVELVMDHTFLLGRGPVQSITNVQVGGYPAPAGIYSVNPAADPARIRFTRKPYAYRFAAGSTFLAMQFDAIGYGNTALQAYLAYDAADDATAAQINKDHRTLALKQVTNNPDRGAIVKAYLAVEHWESNTIVNDYAEVNVEGIGVVGRLSRPNPAEGIAIDAEVDIDHGHSHQIGGDHTHTFYDPVLSMSEEPHTHTTDSSGNQQTYDPLDGDEAFALWAPYTPNAVGESYWVHFPDAPASWSSAILRFFAHLPGGNLRVGTSYWAADGNNAMQFGSRSSTRTLTIDFTAYGRGVVNQGAAVNVSNIRLEVITDTIVNQASTGANTQVSISGRNQPIASDKRSTDVNDLATDNVEVQVNTTEASTRSHVNLFDLTSHVNFNWSWFTNRTIWVTYRGSTDNQTIYILHCFFDVEYRKREQFFSDDVSAEVVGLIDDGAGTYTGTPSALITRPDHVVRRLLLGPGSIDAETVDPVSYAAVGARLAAKGYTIDGVIRGDARVKDTLKKIAFQARIRPHWSAGLSKLVFVEAFEDWPEGYAITAADYQLNSIAVDRQAAAEITNQVDLFFARDWTNDDDGPAGFADSVRAAHAESIARFGVRNKADRWLFDLVRSSAMAADLAGFYCNRYATPSTYYSVNGYLPLFSLEKEDKVELTAGFNRLRKAKMRILGTSRGFGSGKNRAINTIALILECVRYNLVEHSEADAVAVVDALSMLFSADLLFEDSVHMIDGLVSATAAAIDETIDVNDALSMIAVFLFEITETVTASDALGVGVGIALEDNVNTLDDVEGWRQFGFGGGQFGFSGFGGWVVWYNRAPDEIGCFENLSVDMIAGPMQDTAAVDDGLYLHSGFGCPIGTGFGLAPFGK